MADLYDGRELVTTEAVLLEIGNGLARKFKAEAIEIIENFIAADEVRIVPLDAELFEKSLTLYKSHQDKAWGLVDCSSFIVMRELGIVDVLTVDHDFKQAGFNTLMRRRVPIIEVFPTPNASPRWCATARRKADGAAR